MNSRRSTSIVNQLSVLLNIPQVTKPSQDTVLSLPQSQPIETDKSNQQNLEKSLPIQSEESHTDESRSKPPIEQNPKIPPANPFDESPLDFEIEYETGNAPEIQVADPADEEDNLPLSQVKRIKEKAKEQKEKETPSPVQKSKRKQSTAEQTVPQETIGSKKRKKNIQTQQPEIQPDVSAVAPLEMITPQFLSDEYAARWDSINQRKILSERYLDVEKFKSQCQLMPVFEKLNLVKSVTTQRSYPPIAIKEFYANLMKTIKEAGSSQYGRVWLRGNEYNFNTPTINLYLGIDASDIEDPILGANTITKVITGGTYSYWPVETNMLPAKSLSTKFAILHKIAMTNWMSNEHRGGLNLPMATLI
ncbi:uncharacterized protein LOC116024105 [Ipomoea triloba]|uniref:uncharacterized protein LOC116024105 n=1 Tax=Ipomoea triloba TaxID=35885 RepID=UPI00125D00B2|nr:uncharacterized protein LOC116024105 [Ipomoea triloba]